MPIVKTIDPKSKITITVNDEMQEFDGLYQASYFLDRIRYDDMRKREKAETEVLFKSEDVKTIYQVRNIFQVKFGIWVARSKKGTYNLRKGGSPLIFANKKMFDLTKDELFKFYERFCKVNILE
jgi:hypothetical protein